MRRSLKLAVVLIALVLVPLRGVAAAAMQILPAAPHQPMQAQAGEAGGAFEHPGCHHDEAPPQGSGDAPGCGTCGEHGCCASVLPAPSPGVMPALCGAARVAGGTRFAAGFVPEHLDPPPLAL